MLGIDPVRDRAELQRLDLISLPDAHLAGRLDEGYADAGFALDAVRPVARCGLAQWPSTWSRRLAHGRERSVVRVEATASGF